jgi:Raf kinase inhibitor-like YbhB/YbcL family protein
MVYSNLILLIMTLVSSTTLTIKSPAFAHNDFIPSKYTCDGENVNPELSIKDLPANTKSLALVVEDSDAPSGTFDHWVMWNIPVTDKIKENSAPGQQGKNGAGENKYAGPCPPKGTHHYHFKVYAVDTELKLEKNSDKAALMNALEGHIIAHGEIIGVYKRK